MGNVSEEYYRYLCDIVINACEEHVNSNKILGLKYKYEDNINSNRRFETINSVRDLIKLLEKRDDLSSENVTILHEIAAYFNQSYLLNTLHDRTNITTPTVQEMHVVQHNNHLIQSKICKDYSL